LTLLSLDGIVDVDVNPDPVTKSLSEEDVIKALVSPKFSLARLLRAPRPKEELVDEAISILAVGLEKLEIVWNPQSFRNGLLNPELPKNLLEGLEGFVEIGLKLGWEFPKSIAKEFDKLVEDVESFCPSFRKAVAASTRPKSKRVGSSGIEKSLGL
jgi:hypothetical protein